MITEPPGPEEESLSRRFADLLHVDDPLRLRGMEEIARDPGSAATLDPERAMLIQMLAYQIDGRHDQTGDHVACAGRLARHPDLCGELLELARILQAKSTLPFRALPGLEETPLCLHARYDVREILTAVGRLTASRRSPFQAGVLPLKERKTELLFVTLDKSSGFHDRISYHDYAISTERFHWQSQNGTGPDTTVGRRYLESGSNGWRFQLFVRPRKCDAYHACGEVALESAEGDRPMSIVWRFKIPLPIRLFREFSVLRGV